MQGHFKQIDDIIGCFIIELQEALDNVYFELMRERDPIAKRSGTAKLNKYRDFWLHGYSMKKAPSFDSLNRQFNEIQELLQKDSITNDIDSVIEEINKQCSSHCPKSYIVRALIFKAIHLIKLSIPMMSVERKAALISELNKVILKQNNIYRREERLHGLIIELKPYGTSYKYDTSMIVYWNCLDCGCKWIDSIAHNSDIFAPLECQHCRGCNISLHESKKLSLWQKILRKFECTGIKPDQNGEHRFDHY